MSNKEPRKQLKGDRLPRRSKTSRGRKLTSKSMPKRIVSSNMKKNRREF